LTGDIRRTRRQGFALLYLQRACARRRRRSFPTRRSSDLSYLDLISSLRIQPFERKPCVSQVGAGERPVPACHSLLFVRAYRHPGDRKSTRLNSSHVSISYAVFCLKKYTATRSASDCTTVS